MKPYRLHNGEMLPKRPRKSFERWAWQKKRIAVLIGYPQPTQTKWLMSRVDDPLNWDYTPAGDG